MTRDEFCAALGREPSATDQMPGTYRFRLGRKHPWQALRISYQDGLWFAHVNGTLSGCNTDPSLIPVIGVHGPFHAITETDYMAILRDYASAESGSPLKTPDRPVNMRQAPPL